LTGLICLGVGFMFLDNSDRHEWFSVSILFLYSVGLVVLYLTALTIIGFVTRFLKMTDTSKSIFKTTGLSFLIILAFMIFTNYSMNRDFNIWKAQTEKDSIQAEKLEQEKYTLKMDSLNEVIEKLPDNYEAIVERGLMKRQKGQYEASIIDYKKALNINPDNFKANLEMGYSLGLLDRKEEQDSFYRVAARLDTSSYFAKKHPEYLK